MNKKITEYGLVITGNLLGIEESVEQSISVGWQPIGGVCFDGKLYTQSMVKYETNATELPKSV